MNESFPSSTEESSVEATAEIKKLPHDELVELVIRLTENKEGLVFQGLEAGALERLRAEGEEYPGYATPIDELIRRFEAEGIKIVSGDHGGSENALVLPKGSDDAGMDSILPRDLKITDDMDPDLKKYILNSRALKAEANAKG